MILIISRPLPLRIAVLGVVLLTLVACKTSEPPVTDTPVQPVSPPSANDALKQVTEAYQQPDPAMRREALYTATLAYLSAPESAAWSNAELSIALTEASLASGSLLLPAPAFADRHEQTAIVALPDGIGLLLYDLTKPLDTPPLELTRWTVGMNALDVTWADDANGITYTTVGADGMTRTHLILAERNNSGWNLVWHSDEEVDWWFNIYDADLLMADDLSTFTVTGKALETSTLFNETASNLYRVFTVNWKRTTEGYQLVTSPPANDPHVWYWDHVNTSPYATLVEFLERLVLVENDGLRTLVTSGSVISSARNLGLADFVGRYQVLSISETGDRLAFGNQERAFEVRLTPPDSSGGIWRISDIAQIPVSSNE